MSTDAPTELGRGAWLASRTLLAFSAVAVGLLAVIHQLAAPRIAAAEAEAQLRTLRDILPANLFDNALLEDTVAIDLPPELAIPGRNTLWIARRQGAPVAAILPVRSREGYSGDIDLLVGVYRDGRIAGVRVIQHRETPGLGDAIEAQRSDWIRQFDQRSLDNPTAAGWRVKKDGGAFDQLTGATITPRAVVKAVQGALQFHQRHADQIYVAPEGATAPPSETSS
ncbi:MAG: electron transport complex subunit RsxG [Oceanococcaceae bacterium]